jgi:Amt family ammonium transporter
MKKIITIMVLALTLGRTALMAADPAPAPTPTMEQRVSSLEAYLNNTDPTTALKDKDGKIPGGLVTPTSAVAGPGHNAWMMTSSALVLFMTLPGLFLFYGGLVRRKNILSVIAQCFGIAGLVTILWVVFGIAWCLPMARGRSSGT